MSRSSSRACLTALGLTTLIVACELGTVTVPTLVLHGALDGIVPVDVARQYAAALPNSRLELVADGAHLVEYEDPKGIADRVAAFASAG